MKYKIADVVWEINPKYDYSKRLLKDYLTQEEAQEEIIITEEILNKECSIAPDFSKDVCESTCVFRQISKILLDRYDGVVFHASCIMIGKDVYAFTAPSGTGKSTHSSMWKKAFGEQVEVLNDDKPLLRKIDGRITVYGTPWKGKHDLGKNSKGVLKALCKIERSPVNCVEPMNEKEALLTILNQTLRPNDANNMQNLLNIAECIIKTAKVCKIKCTPTVESAYIARKALEDNYED